VNAALLPAWSGPEAASGAPTSKHTIKLIALGPYPRTTSKGDEPYLVMPIVARSKES
jgi:hypothetical protein